MVLFFNRKKEMENFNPKGKILDNGLVEGSEKLYKYAKRIGFWKSDDMHERYVEANSYIDKDWAFDDDLSAWQGVTYLKREARACYIYLKHGFSIKYYDGWTEDVFERENGNLLSMVGGNDNITPDGKWLYPDGWEVYIEKHFVKPPSEEFINDALDWYLKFTAEFIENNMKPANV